MAFASLLSLTQALEQILHPHDRSLSLHQTDQQTIRSLHEKFSLLLSFLEDSSYKNSETIRSLEERIRDVTYEAEVIIETQMLNQILLQSGCREDITEFNMSNQIVWKWEQKHEGLQKVLEELHSVSEEMKKMKDGNDIKDLPPRNSLPAGSSQDSSSNKSSMVGYNDYLMEIMERLTQPPLKREIIPIVGMGGIGKTTLARNVYDDLRIVDYFDTRAWITVSQGYQVIDMITGLLKSIKHAAHELYQEDIGKLYQLLHKSLKGNRYLIVMDDVWDIKAWEDVKRVFPDDDNGSRIIFTTRQSIVARQVQSSGHIQHLKGLDVQESWILLREKAFGKENCPPQLEKIGTEIAKNCKGLPLSLVVIGGLLYKAERTEDYWNYVSENLYSAVSKASHHEYLEILSLSYNHLPHYSRACFLYMSVLPEDYVIRKSKLTKLWVANGFIKPDKSKSLEELAEEYLKDLTDRNLIMVHERVYSDEIKSCSIHDLLRELCVIKAKEEKFLQVLKLENDHFPEVTDNLHHVSIHTNFKDQSTRFSLAQDCDSPIRSVIFFCRNNPNHLSLHFITSFRLLKVLDALTIRFDEFPIEIVELFNLRYIALTYWIKHSFPASISKLFNLETLIVNPGKFKEVFNTSFLPLEIWKMPRLRHLLFVRAFFPYPTDALNGGNFVPLQNLQTLSNVINFRWTKEVLQMLPNLKKLVISYEHDGRTEWSSYCFDNFIYLHRLEVLKCYFFAESYLKYQDPLPVNFAFPPQLKKLTLSGCRISWESMTIIGSLPKLEVLKLKDHAFEGPVWEPIEGEFSQLKFLLLEETDLEQWNADKPHFPILKRLHLRYCYNLLEIPSGFENIPTFQAIELCECSSSVVASAKSIQEMQKDCGNEKFQVVVKDEESNV
ncbi:late blight resistance homolog R1A-10 isoform X1 [Olea europaea subsp. europaea]|uniref:Late blight resistance homolog R1A-10 isoform X1 n=2 Tax=Olea europaea subsp. europaea TaxID=158383 RepID=A0A8S0PJC4_OLEEU|nr:late blight resistance homolog R1A-10 isoform X1 [Olea europaea subsp. europaea]